MFTRNHLILIIAITSVLFFSSCGEGSKNVVKDKKALAKALENVEPGNTITLANGVWNDTEILFEGKGTKDKPITLQAETPGKVLIKGESNLRMAGEYLVVKGLVFTDGYTPTNEVISFKKTGKEYCNNCRLTACVIDNFSPAERHEPDSWVAIYGKNNQVDHNHFEDKRNRGVTLIVRLNEDESLENYHKVEYNYFGPRQNLGSNGGESLRIGTSHHSRKNSNTMVAYNYFDRCNGEHEIISNKSCQNTYKGNLFYECTGTLTMRHGNETLVEGNIFLGNDKPSTGGIRVINGQQKVINNYGIGLTGYRFRGALVLMNGIYNSPINRYDQVVDAVVKNNTFINCDHVQLCAGSDAERSAPPIKSVIEDNIFYNEDQAELFTVYDDISGINFDNNIVSETTKNIIGKGVEGRKLTLAKGSNGLLNVTNAPNVGAGSFDSIPDYDNTGVSWYPKGGKSIARGSGKKISVEPGLNSLVEAVSNAKAGDILNLKSGETYSCTKTIAVNVPISIQSDGETKAKIMSEKKSVFEIQNGGLLSLANIHFDASAAPDRTGNSIITTSKYSMNKNYSLFIDQCIFENLDVNHSFDAIRVYKNTFADTIQITNSVFKNVNGNIMSLDKEDDDIGIYNVEYVILKNNVFTDVSGMALNLYRGGKDESTFGPFLEIDHCVFSNVGNGKRNKKNAAISLYGVQVNHIQNNVFDESKGINMHLVVGEPIVKVLNNNFHKTAPLKVTGDQAYEVKNTTNYNPMIDEKTWLLDEKSKLVNKGTDGENIGIMKPVL